MDRFAEPVTGAHSRDPLARDSGSAPLRIGHRSRAL